jgi:NADH-quinone oxidoreductase subunit L
VGAFAAGAFHLMTHAFFKALLFLGSGSVIHGMGGEQDMRRMGALKRYLPVTYATMMVGMLAIAGIPPFSGFFSKDEILYRAFLGHRAIWVLAVITAGMTAFYMFRLVAMTFLGAYRGPAFAGSEAHSGPTGRGHDDHAGHGHGHSAWHGPHESPRMMTVPLILLAAGATVAGFVGIPAALGGANRIEHFLAPSFEARSAPHATDAAAAPSHGEAGAAAGRAAASEASHEAAHLSTAGELGLMAFSVVVALAGIAVGRRLYVQQPGAADRLADRLPVAYRTLLNKYWVDELYHATVVRGTLLFARLSWRFDALVVDGAVNGSGWTTRFAAWVSGLIDKYIVDGLVNGTGATLREASLGFRRMQTGLVQTYALLMMIGVFALVSAYLVLR